MRLQHSMLLATSLVGVPAFAQDAFNDHARMAEITRCIRSVFASAQSPEAQPLRQSTDYMCTTAWYLDSSDPDSDELNSFYTVDSHPEYNFRALSYRGAYQNKLTTDDPDTLFNETHYLPTDGGLLEGISAIKQGVRRGFLTDFLRVTSDGVLISEESVLTSDADNFIVHRNAPSALSDRQRLVYRYRVCSPVTSDNDLANTCFVERLISERGREN